VCELPDAREAFATRWDALVEHVRLERSDLVVLPEMPFCVWFARARQFNPETWSEAVAEHDRWEQRLAELSPALVIGTRPIDFGNERYNSGFVWSANEGLRTVHAKTCLPNEEGAWEASWYNRAAPEFVPVQEGDAEIGFAIGSELWAMEHVRSYGQEDVNLLVTPRLTSAATLDKWLAAGRVAAVLAAAYGLSSNRIDEAIGYGGQAWIVDPDGQILGLTGRDQPFVTRELDLEAARRARRTYPRYCLCAPDSVRPA
jgi:N-carbamoylputrescine amidase